MSCRNRGKKPRMDLNLNISPPRDTHQGGMAAESSPMKDALPPSSSVSSFPSSCLSSGAETGPDVGSMVLMGCPRCLMFVMFSEKNPRCPKCKNTDLLDFHGNNGGHGRMS